MIRLKVLDILEEKGKSKYWLWKQMNTSYQNFNKIVSNKTGSIRYSNIELLCDILECTPGDLFEYSQEKDISSQ